jgi:hypothetical protein
MTYDLTLDPYGWVVSRELENLGRYHGDSDTCPTLVSTYKVQRNCSECHKCWVQIRHICWGYPSTLANSTLLILFSKMLRISKIICSKSKNIVKDNSEYSRNFPLLKWILRNSLSIWRTFVEMAKVVWYCV